jgi:hypothetical protein
MKTTDFSDYAEAWVNELQDNPEQQLPDKPPPPRSFPKSLTNLAYDDSVVDIENGEEFPDEDVAAQDEDGIEAAQDTYPLSGLDVLAFYKSFRFQNAPPFPGTWGIYILDVGLAALGRDMRVLAPQISQKELRTLAADILLTHERYHFWIDAWALGMEIVPLAKKYKRYEPYLAWKRAEELTPFDYEESLANHYVYKKLGSRRFSDGSSAKLALKHVLDSSPIPYCDYILPQHLRAEKEGVLAVAIANGVHCCVPGVYMRLSSQSVSALSASIQPCSARHPITGWSQCPVRYVRTRNYASVVSPFRGPTLREFKDFITGYLNGKPLSTTDHSFYRIDNGERIKLPNPHDKELRSYELKSTLLKAGMRLKEYIEAKIATDNWCKNCPRPVAKPSLLSR